MKVKVVLLFFILSLFAFQAAAADLSVVTEKYRQAKSSLEQLYKAKEGVYARDILDEARRTLVKAQEGIDAKNEKAICDAVKMASLRMEQAKAKTEEREAAEKTAVTRAKADKLEKRLADILAGKGGGK
jgi:hypothetical protein